MRLVLDTATKRPTLCLSHLDGLVDHVRQWESQHRHGEELLQQLNDLLASAGAVKKDLDGVIVGLGPGSFTGLRIGLATAKTIAYSLRLPIVGVSTTHALALAAFTGASEAAIAVSLPAGAVDRYVHRVAVDGDSVKEEGPPQLVVPGAPFDEAVSGSPVVAVDMEGAEDLSDDAIARGEEAVRGLARALAKLGTKALDEGRADDVAQLVPAYVALPRGIAKAAAEMTWSPDLR